MALHFEANINEHEVNRCSNAYLNKTWSPGRQVGNLLDFAVNTSNAKSLIVDFGSSIIKHESSMIEF